MSERDLIRALLNGQPYFGPAFRALQSPVRRYACLDAIIRHLGDSIPGEAISVLEIGSWVGASAITWALALKDMGREGKITCVDLWQPYFDLEVDQENLYATMNEAAEENGAFKLFQHNVSAAGVSDLVDTLIGNSREVLPTLREASYDIVYIDGSHLYENVKGDIENAKRLVRAKGVVCGDDLELQRHEVSTEEHLSALELGRDFVTDPRAGREYHPGVTEAVAEAFTKVTCWDGIWAVQKRGQEWQKVAVDPARSQVPAYISTASVPDVEQVGETENFNLVRTGARYLAVAKSLGPLKLFGDRIGERELVPVLFVDGSLEVARAKAVEYECRQRQLQQAEAELAATQGVLAGTQGVLAGTQGELAATQGELAGIKRRKIWRLVRLIDSVAEKWRAAKKVVLWVTGDKRPPERIDDPDSNQPPESKIPK